MPRNAPSFNGNNKSQASKPTNWPTYLQFIHAARYHYSVSPVVRQHIQGSSSSSGKGNETSIPPKRPKVVIRNISSSSHPACGQLGLFAAQRIPPKTRIIYYIGEVHCDDRPDSDYDLSLCRLLDGVNVGIDASATGNQARFINDYRGIANRPNAVFLDGREQSGELCMSIWSSNQEIKKDEEILVSYGKSWWRSRSVNRSGEPCETVC